MEDSGAEACVYAKSIAFQHIDHPVGAAKFANNLVECHE